MKPGTLTKIISPKTVEESTNLIENEFQKLFVNPDTDKVATVLNYFRIIDPSLYKTMENMFKIGFSSAMERACRLLEEYERKDNTENTDSTV